MGYRKRQRRSKQAKVRAARAPLKLADTRALSVTALTAVRRRAVRAVVVLEQEPAFVAELMGVHLRTVQNWVRDYQRRGEEALQLAVRRGRKSSHPLDEAEQQEVVELIRDGTPESCGLGPEQLWTRKLVGDLIEQRYGVSRSVCRIGAWLREWGMSYVRPSKRAAECDQEAVRKWVEEEFPAIARRAEEEGATVYWGDQSGLSSREPVARTWAPRGEKAEVERVAKRFHCNLMAAISDEGDMRFTVFEGSFNKEKMVEFLERFADEEGPKKFLILDRHSAHLSHLVSDWAKEHAKQVELFFLPAYSPHLNPAEILNQDIKQHIRRTGSGANKTDLLKRVRSFLFGVQRKREQIVNYFGARTVAYAARW